MLNLGFFNLIAAGFQNRYLNLTNNLYQRYISDRSYAPTTPTNTTMPSPLNPQDSYLPTPTATVNNLPETIEPRGTEIPADVDPAEDGDSYVPNSNPPAATDAQDGALPDGTYRFSRYARLDYKMDLRFDLGVLTSTVRQLADGDSEAVQEFAAANFGFSADLSFKGIQMVNSSYSDDAESRSPELTFSKNRALMRSAGQFAASSDNFALDSFYRQALKIRRSSQVIDAGNHRLAVNRFALRFRMDAGFGMTYLNQFNVQTNRIADQAPQSVNSFVETAGSLAESGSNEMMAEFFNAVESYLDGSQQMLTERAAAYFDAAAEELGFSEDLIAIAKDQYLGTIDSFFDRVDESIRSLKSHFVAEPEPADILTTDAGGTLNDGDLPQIDKTTMSPSLYPSQYQAFA